MASLNSIYIKLETLETIVKTLKAKNEQGIKLTASINDQPNEYGQNISLYIEQTQEQREQKKPRFYVGNGKTFWTDGLISIPAKVEKAEATPAPSASDDLPF